MLKSIFKNHWKEMSLSYMLMIFSNMLLFLYPKVLGDTIDKILNKEYYYLIFLFLIFFGFILLSYLSNIYDTRVFSKIHRIYSRNEMLKQYDNNIDTTLINGRYTMMNSIINFFEYDITRIISTLFSLIGSLYIISRINYLLGLGLIISAILSMIVTKIYTPKIAEITNKQNNLHEEQLDVFKSRKTNILNNFLRRKYKLAINISNVYAMYTVYLHFIAYATVTILLFLYIIYEDVTVGNTFSTYKYLFEFVSAVATIPGIINSFINLKDVLKRFNI